MAGSYTILKISLHTKDACATGDFLVFRNLFPDIGCIFLPPANEVCEGYVFIRVCHSVRGVLSQHALQVVSQHALQQVSRGGFHAHTQGGS